MMKRSNSTQRFAIFITLLALSVVFYGLGLTKSTGIAAQIEDGGWVEPVNLSQSGSTTDPRLVLDSNGLIHALWLDLNAGFIYSRFTEEGWDPPEFVNFPFTPQNVEVLVLSDTFELKPPLLIADINGYIHAFWQDPRNSLLYSRVFARDIKDPNAWIRPRFIAESAASFDVEIDSQGRIHVVYVRTIGNGGLPAGVYYRYSRDDGLNWEPGVALYSSRYLQGLDSDETNVQLSSITQEDSIKLIVVWDNLRLRRVFLLRSIDRGISWGDSVEIDGPEYSSMETPYNINAFVEGNQVLLTWQADLGERVSCLHYFQTSKDGGETWDVPSRMLERNLSCPSSFYFLNNLEGKNIFWTVLQGQVYLLAWDWEVWSEPQRQSNINQFTNPVTFQRVSFGCEYGLLLDDKQLFAVGCDEEDFGDIWATSRFIENVDEWYVSKDFWSPPVVAISDGLEILDPVFIADDNGVLHLLWQQLLPAEGLQPQEDEALYYAEKGGEAWVLAGDVIYSPLGKVSQPSLAVDASNRLYATWSEGGIGEIYISWASASKAASKAEWNEPKLLPSFRSVNSSPEILVGDVENIFVIYAIPLNEDRGIYLTKSTDIGATWSEPARIFDATAQGWDMIDQPHLAISRDGTLHVIWTRYALIDATGNAGLYYSHSGDYGETWSEALSITDSAVRWSRLLSSGDTLHRLWLESIADASILWHEVSFDNGLTWIRFSVLSGFGEQEDNFSVVSDGVGGLHVIQMAEVGIGNWVLRYLLWDGERWSIQDETELLLSVDSRVVSSVAEFIPGGRLGVFYAVERPEVVEGKNVLNFIERELDLQEPFEITAVPQSTPEKTPTPIQPTETPTPTQNSATDAQTTLAQLPTEIALTATAQAASPGIRVPYLGELDFEIVLLAGSGIFFLALVGFLIGRRRRKS